MHHDVFHHLCSLSIRADDTRHRLLRIGSHDGAGFTNPSLSVGQDGKARADSHKLSAFLCIASSGCGERSYGGLLVFGMQTQPMWHSTILAPTSSRGNLLRNRRDRPGGRPSAEDLSS